MARQIEVVVAGRHAASGDFGAIRRLMTDRPNRFVLRTDDDRRLASVLLGRRLGPGRPAPRPRAASRWRPPTSAGSARSCRGWPASTASGCWRSPPPTSRSRASSPTWCRRDGADLADHRRLARAQRLRPPARGPADRAAAGAARACGPGPRAGRGRPQGGSRRRVPARRRRRRAAGRAAGDDRGAGPRDRRRVGLLPARQADLAPHDRAQQARRRDGLHAGLRGGPGAGRRSRAAPEEPPRVASGSPWGAAGGTPTARSSRCSR